MKTKINLTVIAAFMVITTQFVNAGEPVFITRTIYDSFEIVTEKVITSLKNQGFSVITEIDMDKKLEEKLENIEMKPYKILGVCNPEFAYQSLQTEENIGVFLPCKVIIKQIDESTHEVVIADPVQLMNMLDNPELNTIAAEVSKLLVKAIDTM